MSVSAAGLPVNDVKGFFGSKEDKESKSTPGILALPPKQREESLILPPTIEKLTRMVDPKEDPSDIDSPLGPITLDETGQLFESYLSLTGMSGFLIEGYNAAIARLPIYIQSRHFTSTIPNVYGRSERISFANVRFLKPKYPRSRPGMESKNDPLYPLYALENGLTYESEIIAEIRIEEADRQVNQYGAPANMTVNPASRTLRQTVLWREKPNTRRDIVIGHIPVMLGSGLCYLSGVTPRERWQRFKIPEADPLGYFIISGSEKVVIGQDLQRYNKIRIDATKDGSFEIYLTNLAADGATSVTKLNKIGSTGQDSKGRTPRYIEGEYVLRSEAFGRINDAVNRVNAIVLLRMLAYLYPTSFTEVGRPPLKFEKEVEVLQFLYLFIPQTEDSNNFARVRQILAKIKEQYILHQLVTAENAVSQLYNDMMNWSNESNSTDEKKKLPIVGIDEMKQHIMVMFDQYLFPHIAPKLDGSTNYVSGQIPLYKAYLVALLIVRAASYECGLAAADRSGYTQLSNRDSFSEKQVRFAGPMIEQLFRQGLSDILKKMASSSKTNNLDDFANRYPSNRIHEIFVQSFTRDEWGVGRRIRKNVSQALKIESPIGMIDHLRSFDVGNLDKHSKTEANRVVQASQYELADAGVTAEGDKCGITKKLTVVATTTLYQNDNVIWEALKRINAIGAFDNKQNVTTLVVLNCIPLGWCDGRKTRDSLVEMRRRTSPTAIIIPDKTEIVYEAPNNTLYINTDGDILVRPVLVVDSDGQLRIDKYGLRPGPAARDSTNKAVTPSPIVFARSLDAGAIEYIGAWEEEWNVKRASRYIDIANFNKNKERAKQSLSQKISQRLMLEKEVEKFGAISVVDIKEKDLIELRQVNEQLSNVKREIGALEKIIANLPFTHCSLDPQAQCSIGTALIPYMGHNPAARNTYQANMSRAIMGYGLANQSMRISDKAVKALAYPTPAPVQTQLAEIAGLNDNRSGVLVTLMLAHYDGWGKEDAFVIRKGAIDMGLFHVIKMTTYTSEVKLTGENAEKFERPTVRIGENVGQYHAIGANGLPAIHARLRAGDVVIGKTRRVGKELINDSIRIKPGEEGIVDDIVVINDNASSRHIVNVRIRTYRRPEIGDKFAPRFAQKATIGIIEADENMPFIPGDPKFVPGAGKAPDMIMNPLALVGRMTTGLMLEMITGIVATQNMQRIDASAFRTFDFETLKAELLKLGYTTSGKRRMIDGRTGRAFYGDIFVGPCYVQALRHHVRDKIQVRGTGHVRMVDRQPPGGKAQHGGTHNGEMEYWAMASHGATAFIQDRSCTSSDAITRIMCKHCKIEAIQTDTGEFLPCSKCRRGAEAFLRVTTPFAQIRMSYLLAAAGLLWRPNFMSVEQYEQSLKTIRNAVNSQNVPAEIIASVPEVENVGVPVEITDDEANEEADAEDGEDGEADAGDGGDDFGDIVE